MADGSSITNVSASGLPTQTENRAYAFCLGTQILQNPASDPRTGTLSFKVSTELFDVAQAGDTVGTTAIGLATSDNISSIATWAPSAEISDDGSTYEVYAVSFAEDSVESTLVNVAIGGASVDTLAKNRTASGVDTVARDRMRDCQSPLPKFSIGSNFLTSCRLQWQLNQKQQLR